MTLKETLQQMKSASRSKLTIEVAAVISGATEDLERSGIVSKALGPGKPAPAFVLTDAQGVRYNSQELLFKGPLILTFYRGSW